MNKLTLLIDGGWITMRYFSVLNKQFDKTLPDYIRQEASQNMSEMIARSISSILNKFPAIDNLILTTEGGSWRKQLPIPQCLAGESYKSNRKHAVEMDWPLIYESFNRVANIMQEKGITVSKAGLVEGDDWMWYWSKRLNSEGINCLIWSSDADLKQLVCSNQNGTWTAWYNDKAGLFLHKSLNCSQVSDIDFFMNPIVISGTLESIKKAIPTIAYIDPDDIILDKIMRGDNSDNIKSVIRYTKNGRQYRLPVKDWDSIRCRFNISTIQDLLSHQQQIIESLSSNSKFVVDSHDVRDMLVYNTKLVWLHESQIPLSIMQNMNCSEYKIADVRSIKQNYNYLLPDNEYIKNIFESDEPPF